jgi:hypothetical protein
MSKLTEIHDIAQGKGGKCLSIRYINAHTKLLWQCSEGHQWAARLNSIKGGTWCPICARKKISDLKKLGIEEMKEIALERGGLCLSDKYLGVHKKLLWRCAEGHEWENAPKAIKAGKWCPVCRQKEANNQCYEELKTIAQRRAGKLLSTEYKGTDTKLLWECSEAHQWEARPHDIKKGVWCPACGIRKRAESRKDTLEDMIHLANLKGGSCLSEQYIDSQHKLLWECSEGHQWQAYPSNIKSGHWCPYCASNTKGTIEQMCQIAEYRGGKCLSTIYINNHTSLLWECSRGHQWQAKPNTIKNGHWCPICATQKGADVLRDSIETYKQIAEERGGNCISARYLNNVTKLLWKCSEGHQWESSPSNIKRGHWCPYCAGNEKGTIEEMQELAEIKGGKCLSDKYINSQTKLLWECSEGHQWEAKPSSIKRGDWCPKCAGKAKGTIQEMQELAESKGGKCLSSEYINSVSNLLWECSEGHQWESPPSRIKIGQWCPECSSGLGERISREFFQQLFGKKFPSSKPKWLINEDGNRMEFDGYCRSLCLAFEHQGEQHFSLKTHYIKTYEELSKRQADDARKKALCVERKIALIEIPEIPNRLPIEKVKKYIKEQCVIHHVKIPEGYDSITVDLRTAYNAPQCYRIMTELQKIANEHGGKCLSKTYRGSKTKLLWECSDGHKWEATPASVKNIGSWCIVCAGKAKGIIEEMQKIAESRGGKCLSEYYINSITKLSWECHEGHRWQATPRSIRIGSWCPACGKNRAADALRDSIRLFRSIATERGGKCLSNKYTNSGTKLLWECSNGHQWKARPRDIKRGSWCPYCSKTSRKCIDDMKQLAQKRGGKCLSNEHVNAHTKLLWQCELGHKWEAKPNNIQTGSWCPICANQRKLKIPTDGGG